MLKKTIILIAVMLFLLLLCSCVGISGVFDTIKSEIDNSDSAKNSEKLYNAIVLDNFEALKEAVDDGVDINKFAKTSLRYRTHNGNSDNPVCTALGNKRNRLADYLVEQGADGNCADSAGYTVLMYYAAYRKDMGLCKKLIDNGANVNLENDEGYTALECYLEESEIIDISMVNFFVENGIKIRPKTLSIAINAIDKESTYEWHHYNVSKRLLEILKKDGHKLNITPEMEAVILGESEKLDNILKGNRNVPNKDIIMFYTAAFGDVKTLELLKSQGVKFAKIDVKGDDPAAIAARFGNVETMKWLLETPTKTETDIDKDRWLYSAMYEAVINRHFDEINWFIEMGYVEDILYFSSCAGDFEILNLVIDKVKSSEFRYDFYITAAIDNNHSAMAAYWFQYKDKFSDSTISLLPFDLNDACLHGQTDMVKVLLENGVDPNGEKSDGRPLRTALQYGNSEVVKLLVRHGADVNLAKDCDELSLIIAIRRGRLEDVKILIDAGAYLSYKGTPFEGAEFTPLEIAEKSLSYRIADYLRNVMKNQSVVTSNKVE